MEKNIYEKMALATDKISRVAKNLNVGSGKNSYKAVGEADVLSAVKPIENECGIYSYPIYREIEQAADYTSKTEYGDKITKFVRIKTTYRFVNIENKEDYIDIVSFGDGVDPQDKASGKAMTYCDKYALLKAYKIETGEDPDQNYSKDMYKDTKQEQKITDKQWCFTSGRYKGLGMIDASKKDDFNEYIQLLKDTDKFTKEMEEEYNIISKFYNLSKEIKEIDV